ncbi:MAG: hypothetical protein AB7V48_08425 [Sedimentibacter sp.]
MLKPYRVRNMFVRKSETCGNSNNLIKENIKYGFLEVSVYNRDENKPLENAEVRISLLTISGLYQEKGEGRIITSVKTGVNGYAPLLTLPTLNRLQRIEDNVNSLYIMVIEAEGYYNAYAFDIQIYPNITTSYRINLIEDDPNANARYEFYIEPQIPGHL